MFAGIQMFKCFPKGFLLMCKMFKFKKKKKTLKVLSRSDPEHTSPNVDESNSHQTLRTIDHLSFSFFSIILLPCREFCCPLPPTCTKRAPNAHQSSRFKPVALFAAACSLNNLVLFHSICRLAILIVC